MHKAPNQLVPYGKFILFKTRCAEEWKRTSVPLWTLSRRLVEMAVHKRRKEPCYVSIVELNNTVWNTTMG
jgi:hypothetical protein